MIGDGIVIHDFQIFKLHIDTKHIMAYINIHFPEENIWIYTFDYLIRFCD